MYGVELQRIAFVFADAIGRSFLEELTRHCCRVSVAYTDMRVVQGFSDQRISSIRKQLHEFAVAGFTSLCECVLEPRLVLLVSCGLRSISTHYKGNILPSLF